MTANLSADLAARLRAHHFHPTAAWLTAFVASARPSTPLPALTQTAQFRLLATDITASLSRTESGVFPRDVHDAHKAAWSLAGPLVVQVLDVLDVGHSCWAQVEALEARDRGEATKGREIVRVVPGEVDAPGQADPAAAPSAGPHKVLLQDVGGVRVWALELRSVDGVNVGMMIGCKLLLKNVAVARGVLLLEPACVTVLGGKVESWHKLWVQDRLERLKKAAAAG